MAEEYFWFINHFLWVLQLYESNEHVKKALMRLAEKYEIYEWVQYEIYSCLAVSQNFTNQELHGFYEKLDSSQSWYAKKGIYLLLLSSTEDKQFVKSILSRAAKEKEPTLRREILYLVDLWELKGVSRDDLLDAFGLI